MTTPHQGLAEEDKSQGRWGGGGGGGGRLLISCVPMREQKKNDEKGYFFRAGQCAALSSFRVQVSVHS